MHKPLEGIKILEWGIFHAGPGGPAILSEMGAEVIKIEQPGIGDPIRAVPRYKNIDFGLEEGLNIFYEGANRGKKSITLDLGHEKGREIAYRLVEKADVFLTNLRPVTVKGKKMDYPTLSKINPDLIYASVTSYGKRGPDADKGGFDYQGQGKSGFMYAIGEPDDIPLLAQFGVIDQTTAIMASYQIIIALYIRERFGIAQEVDVSLLGTASYMMFLNNIFVLLAGKEIPRHDQATADPQRNYYKCKDGKWIIQTQPPREENWQKVCRILGLADLAYDPLYNSRDKRLEKSKELVAIFNDAFLTRTSKEWVKLFVEKNLVISEINTTLGAIKDPQMAANDYIVDFDHPVIGKIKLPGFPLKFSRAEINNNFIAPKLGEHTDSVLKEIAGYSDEEIAGFRKGKII